MLKIQKFELWCHSKKEIMATLIEMLTKGDPTNTSQAGFFNSVKLAFLAISNLLDPFENPY